MTPEERDLVAELFGRLAKLESAARDPEAEAAINDGLRQAPHAMYALVQTVMVQDEALKRANEHIRELEAQFGPEEAPPRSGGFLDNMRGALLGRQDQPRPGSVPSVPPVRPGDTPWGAGGGGGYPPGGGAGYAPMGAEPMRPGGSFLGTIAASAAGMIGGSLLLDGMRSLMGHHAGGSGPAGQPGGGTHAVTSPWSTPGGGGSGSGTLAHDAGLDDIGRGAAGQGGDAGSGHGVGLFDSADGGETGEDADFEDAGGDDFDDGGGDGGGDYGSDN